MRAICRGQRGVIPGLLAPEEAAKAEASGGDILSRYLCIHFPHKLSPLVRGMLSDKNTVDVLKEIVSPNVKCMQSMMFVKAPGMPGHASHQDEVGAHAHPPNITPHSPYYPPVLHPHARPIACGRLVCAGSGDRVQRMPVGGAQVPQSRRPLPHAAAQRRAI